MFIKLKFNFHDYLLTFWFGVRHEAELEISQLSTWIKKLRWVLASCIFWISITMGYIFNIKNISRHAGKSLKKVLLLLKENHQLRTVANDRQVKFEILWMERNSTHSSDSRSIKNALEIFQEFSLKLSTAIFSTFQFRFFLDTYALTSAQDERGSTSRSWSSPSGNRKLSKTDSEW